MANGIESLARFQGMQDSALARVDTSDKDKLKETAQEFEAIFVKMLLDTMKKTLNKEDRMVDGGQAEEIFDDMLYTEYSRLMAKSGDFGIANAIIRQYDKAATAITPANPYA